MPGQLKSSARCPICNSPLLFLCDLTSSKSVTREYFHGKPKQGRHKRRCRFVFTDLVEAARERRGLEVQRGKHT